VTTDNIRKNFPLLQQMDTIYLDNAATAQRPSCVLAAVQEFYEQKNANPLRGFYPLSLEATESYQEARKTVQEFIHAEEPEEIIFTRNTTESLNLVAYSYGLNFLKEGDEIAVTKLFKGRRRDRCNNHGASQQSASVADGVAYDWGEAPLSGMYQ